MSLLIFLMRKYYLVLEAKVNWSDYRNASCPWKPSHCIFL